MKLQRDLTIPWDSEVLRGAAGGAARDRFGRGLLPARRYHLRVRRQETECELTARVLFILTEHNRQRETCSILANDRSNRYQAEKKLSKS